jgi:hypothetical protein
MCGAINGNGCGITDTNHWCWRHTATIIAIASTAVWVYMGDN